MSDRCLSFTDLGGASPFGKFATWHKDLYRPAGADEAADVGVVEVVDDPAAVLARLAAARSDPVLAARLSAARAWLIDGSLEGCRLTAAACQRIHDGIASLGWDPRRVVMTTQNTVADAQYAAWAADRVPPDRRITVDVQHAFMRWTVGAARSLLRDETQRARLLQRIERAGEPLPERRFLCLNRRLRWHKQIIVGHLARCGHLARGHASALIALDEAGEAGVPPPHGVPAFAEELDAYQALRPRLPLEIPIPQAPAGAAHLEPALYDATAFSLVVETEMTDGSMRRFTEKLLKPLACGHPVIVAGNPGTLALVRALGFRSFPRLFDEEYDGIEDPVRRLRAVLAGFDRLMQAGDADFAAALRDCREALLHNALLFERAMPDVIDAQVRRLHGLLVERVRLADPPALASAAAG